MKKATEEGVRGRAKGCLKLSVLLRSFHEFRSFRIHDFTNHGFGSDTLRDRDPVHCRLAELKRRN